MLRQIKVTALCKELEEKLVELNYSEDSMRRYRKVFHEFMEYAGDCDYSQSKGTDFLLWKFKQLGDFVIDCVNVSKDQPQTVTCPICGNEAANITDSSIIEASAAELQKIKQNLNDLNTAEESLNIKEDDLVSTISSLEQERLAIDTLISKDLQPELSRFQTKLEESLKYIRLSGEL